MAHLSEDEAWQVQKRSTSTTSGLPGIGSSRRRLRKALEKAAEVASESADAFADAPLHVDEDSSASEDDRDATQVPTIADFPRLCRQRDKLQAKRTQLRSRMGEIKKDVHGYRQKEQEFIAELDRHMQGVEKNEQEMHARIEALNEEQEQLRLYATHQDLEKETLRTQHDEMIAQFQCSENRVQFLMDHLVHFLMDHVGDGDQVFESMVKTIRADGEERDHQSRLRLDLFSKQLEEGRQENRLRAQALSDRQCQTTALHERLCTLQNELFNRARDGSLPTSAPVGPPSGTSLGCNEALLVPEVVGDTISNTTTAASSGGKLVSCQGLTDSMSRLLAKATADLAEVERLSEPDQARMRTALPVIPPTYLQQQFDEEHSKAINAEVAKEVLSKLNLSKSSEAAATLLRTNDPLMSPPDDATSSERVILGSYTSGDDMDDMLARDISRHVTETDPSDDRILGKLAVPSITGPTSCRLDADDVRFEDSFDIVKGGFTGVRHVELQGKIPLGQRGKNILGHDASPLGVSSAVGALAAAASAASQAKPVAPSTSIGQGDVKTSCSKPTQQLSSSRESGMIEGKHKEHLSSERVERRQPLSSSAGASVSTTAGTTVGSGSGSATVNDVDAVASHTAVAMATRILRRTSCPKSNAKIGSGTFSSGGRSGSSSPQRPHIMTVQQQSERLQSSSIDLPSRSSCSSSVLQGSPAVSSSSSMYHSKSIQQVARSRVERVSECNTARQARRESPKRPLMQLFSDVRRFSSTGSTRDATSIPSPRRDTSRSSEPPKGAIPSSTLVGCSPVIGAASPTLDQWRKPSGPTRAYSAPPLPSCSSPTPSWVPALISTAEHPISTSSAALGSRSDGTTTPQTRRLSPSRGISPTRSPSPASPHMLPFAAVANGSVARSFDFATGSVGVPRPGIRHSPSTSWSTTRAVVSPPQQSLMSPRIAHAIGSCAVVRGSSPAPSPGSCSVTPIAPARLSRAGSLRVRPPPGSGLLSDISRTRRNTVFMAASARASTHERDRLSSASPQRS